MFAKQFLETKPWEARSQRHQNSSVVFHWAPATSYLLNATGQDQQKRKPCTAFPDGHSLFLAGILCFWWVFWVSNGHSLFLGGILCFWQASQVILDHLKCRCTGHWSILSSWQWGGREGNMPPRGMRGLSCFGGSTWCLQRQSCWFWQSVCGCCKNTEVWESCRLMTNFPQSLAFFREG